MGQILKDPDPVPYNLVGLAALKVHDKPHPASVMFKGRVV
jgi:hypothetical protein